MNHHTKNKGDVGVLKAQADLAEKGFIILTPHTEHAPFDVGAYKDGDFRRVQVKYRQSTSGKLEDRMRSCWSDRNGVHIKDVDKSEVDVICIYCPDADQCYYFLPWECDKSFTLRISPSLNNQSKNVKLASDYCRVP